MWCTCSRCCALLMAPASMAGDNQPYAVPSLAGCSLVYQARLPHVEPAADFLHTLLSQPQEPRQVAAENVLLILLAEAGHVLDTGRSGGECRRRVRVVAADDEVLAANRLDRLWQTELVWLYRDIKRFPQELA